jgi:hypothetical protein
VLLNKRAASRGGGEVPVVLAVVNVEVALVTQLLKERVIHLGRVGERVVLEGRAVVRPDVHDWLASAGVRKRLRVSLDESAENN